MRKLAILASGTAAGGGSGFERLVVASLSGDLNARVSCVLSNHPQGGVFKRAQRLGVRFEYFEPPWTAERCHNLIGEEVSLIGMSGWLKCITGLDATKTINIHPGPLPDFGGVGMYGQHVHNAVLKAYHQSQVKHSALCMHFVTDEYDKGPIFAQLPVEIKKDDTPDSLSKRVNAVGLKYQWLFTRYVLEGRIYWDGVNPDSLVTVDPKLSLTSEFFQ